LRRRFLPSDKGRRRWLLIGGLGTVLLIGLIAFVGLSRFNPDSISSRNANAAASDSLATARDAKREAVVVPGNVALASAGATVVGPGQTADLIDGVTTGYTGYRGFTQAEWPCTWLVILPRTYLLQEIRLLLWDGNQRHYRYVVETSVDGETFSPLIDRSKGEWRSWQTLTFPPRPVKCIRLQGLHNSANKWFHVVELEAYCIKPVQPAVPRFPSAPGPSSTVPPTANEPAKTPRRGGLEPS
jgi:hypothetical protein